MSGNSECETLIDVKAIVVRSGRLSGVTSTYLTLSINDSVT